MRVANCDEHTVTIRPRILQAICLAAIAYPTTKIRVNATCRKCPHKLHRMEMKTAISCTLFFFFSSRRRHTRCGRDWSSDVCSSDLGIRLDVIADPRDTLVSGD